MPEKYKSLYKEDDGNKWPMRRGDGNFVFIRQFRIQNVNNSSTSTNGVQNVSNSTPRAQNNSNSTPELQNVSNSTLELQNVSKSIPEVSNNFTLVQKGISRRKRGM